MSLKSWLNERPGAAVIEAEEAQRRVEASSEFDPRTEVSADAKAIIRRLTLLLFWIPLEIAIVALGLYLASHY